MSSALDGKVAVITGGADGMGRAAIQRFVEEGAKVVFLDVQKDKGAAIESEYDGEVRFVHGDIREEADMASTVALATEQFGGLDVMYHNAAAPGSSAPLDEITVDEWRASYDLLVTASLLAVKVAIPAMRERGGGSIILTSSIAAYALKTSPPAYPISKGAVLHLMRAAAFRHAADKIRVNAIVPGGIASAIHLKRFNYSQEMADAIWPHLKRLVFERYQVLPVAGEPEDIANAALFLASDQSRFITGVDLLVDGGLNMQRLIMEPEYEAAVAEAERLAKLDLGA